MQNIQTSNRVALEQQVRAIAANLPEMETLLARILKVDGFLDTPSSIDKHHAWHGGNAQHTFEVVLLAMDTVWTAARVGVKLDAPVVFASALLHDIGKIDAYQCVSGVWGKSDAYTKSFHIQQSIARGESIVADLGIAKQWYPIRHCIGAHHGRIDYGALWEPQTKEAWSVHLADMASVFAIHGRHNGP